MTTRDDRRAYGPLDAIRPQFGCCQLEGWASNWQRRLVAMPSFRAFHESNGGRAAYREPYQERYRAISSALSRLLPPSAEGSLDRCQAGAPPPPPPPRPRKGRRTPWEKALGVDRDMCESLHDLRKAVREARDWPFELRVWRRIRTQTRSRRTPGFPAPLHLPNAPRREPSCTLALAPNMRCTDACLDACLASAAWGQRLA